MEPAADLDLPEVAVVDTESGAETTVAVLGRGRCHLLGRFPAHDVIVQFRLDWGDIDHLGHPMMDADFIDPSSGTHIKSASLKPFHHTSPADASGQRYEWDYRDIEYRFEIRVHRLGSISQAVKLNQQVRGEAVGGAHA